jgi:Secretion system C-terminal sorting domain
MMRLTTILAMTMIVTVTAQAQIPPVWIQSYQPDVDRRGFTTYSFIEAHDGGYLLIGSTSDEETVSRGMVLKTDGDGNELWRAEYDEATQFTKVTKVQYQSGDDTIAGFLLSGSFHDHNTDDYGWTLCLIRNDGFFEWNNQVSVNTGFSIQCLLTLPDQSVLVGGCDNDWGNEVNYARLFRITMDNTIIWDNIYVNENFIFVNIKDMALYQDGNHVFTVGEYGLDSWFMKFDWDGFLLDEAFPNDYVNSVVNVGNDIFWVSGQEEEYYYYNTYNYIQFVLQVDGDLNIQRRKNYLQSPDWIISKIIQTPVGFSTFLDAGNGNTWVTGFAYDGARLWIKHYDYDDLAIYDMIFNDDGYLFCGFNVNAYMPIWLSKTSDGPTRYWISGQYPITIPSDGGVINFTVNLDNHEFGFYSDASMSIEYVTGNTELVLETWSQLGFFHGLQMYDLSLEIPADTPAGRYRIVVSVGDNQLSPDYSDWIEFEKQGEVASGIMDLAVDDWDLAADRCGTTKLLDEVNSQIRNTEKVPESNLICEVYPNPFNASTMISVALPDAVDLSVVVYNVRGQQVAELANGQFNAGNHTFTIDASGMASGLYFVRATVPGQLDQVQKMMLVR